jgi:4-hydroxy-3-methylbut-2-enyl diphosphate reductase
MMTIHVGLFSDLPPQARTVVLIGGRNCEHLRELARMAEFRGRAAYRVENADELQPRWFAGVDEVGVVVGASNLAPQVEAVLERLNQFAAAQAAGMLEGVAQ